MSLLPMWKKESRDPVTSLQREMNRLVDDFFGGRSVMRSFFGDGEPGFMPAVDMHETNDKVIVEAELPGIDPKDVDIRVEGSSLVIRGERKHEKEHKEGNYHRVERSYGQFERHLELPAYADPQKTDATYKNGVLKIELAKKEEAKPKSIEVKVK